MYIDFTLITQKKFKAYSFLKVTIVKTDQNGSMHRMIKSLHRKTCYLLVLLKGKLITVFKL